MVAERYVEDVALAVLEESQELSSITLSREADRTKIYYFRSPKRPVAPVVSE
jgi:hypothetical protein